MDGPAAAEARTVERRKGVIWTVWRLKWTLVVSGKPVVSVKLLSVVDVETLRREVGRMSFARAVSPPMSPERGQTARKALPSGAGELLAASDCEDLPASDPDRDRTCDLAFRKRSLYPTELRGREARSYVVRISRSSHAARIRAAGARRSGPAAVSLLLGLGRARRHARDNLLQQRLHLRRSRLRRAHRQTGLDAVLVFQTQSTEPDLPSGVVSAGKRVTGAPTAAAASDGWSTVAQGFSIVCARAAGTNDTQNTNANVVHRLPMVSPPGSNL